MPDRFPYKFERDAFLRAVWRSYGPGATWGERLARIQLAESRRKVARFHLEQKARRHIRPAMER
jgi:hypothetical protein